VGEAGRRSHLVDFFKQGIVEERKEENRKKREREKEKT